MAAHNQLGKAGEEAAQAFLLNKDYTILATNFRIGKLELDIIARKDDLLVIVEVRTRTTDWYLQPEATIDWRKIKHLSQAAQGYIRMQRWQGETRFDIIAVVKNGDGSFQIEHFEDAFRP